MPQRSATVIAELLYPIELGPLIVLCHWPPRPLSLSGSSTIRPPHEQFLCWLSTNARFCLLCVSPKSSMTLAHRTHIRHCVGWPPSPPAPSLPFLLLLSVPPLSPFTISMRLNMSTCT